jgi:hypothetical protein
MEVRNCQDKVCSPAISKTATGSPIQLERAIGVGDELAVEAESFGSCSRIGEVNEAVARIASRRGQSTPVHLFFSTYPENLSRIILTLTCSPIPNQMLRTKFSSIQGSNSPILREYVSSGFLIGCLTSIHFFQQLPTTERAADIG